MLEARVIGDGAPVVILPGLGLDHFSTMTAFEPVFAVAPGYRRFYLDLPWSGDTAGIEPTSAAVLAEVIETVESRLASRSLLVAGHSYGGYLAAALGRRMPDRVRGLLLVCSGLRIRPEDRDLSGVLGPVPEAGWLAGVSAQFAEHLAHAVGLQTALVAGRVSEVLQGTGAVDEAFIEALREHSFALADEDDATPFAGMVRVIAGRRDRVAGYAGLINALDRFPRADCLLFGDAGHYLPFEVPAEFREAVAGWLRSCGSAGLAAGA